MIIGGQSQQPNSTAQVTKGEEVDVNAEKNKSTEHYANQDVEMNTSIAIESTPSSSTPTIDIDIPTRMDIFYDLNGSLGFAIGSSGFVLAMYYDQWLPYFRYGSLIWIWGCVFYSIPLLLKLKKGTSKGNANDNGEEHTKSSSYRNMKDCYNRIPWDIGELGVFLCCLFYTIGCIFGGFFNLDTVERFLPLINHMFLYGSLSLSLEPAWEAYSFVTRGGSCMSRMRKTKLWGSSSRQYGAIDAADDVENSNGSTSSSDNNEDGEKHAQFHQTQTQSIPLKFNWDRCFELSAMIFFCAAGAFGGFPPHPSLALPGQYFWEVGSLFSVARSIVMIRRRREGLKQKQLSDANHSRRTKSRLRKYSKLNANI